MPEWKDYDAEIKNLLNRVQDQEHDEENSTDNEIPAISKSEAESSDGGDKHTEL